MNDIVLKTFFEEFFCCFRLEYGGNLPLEQISFLYGNGRYYNSSDKNRISSLTLLIVVLTTFLLASKILGWSFWVDWCVLMSFKSLIMLQTQFDKIKWITRLEYFNYFFYILSQ